ncbi:ABC transporter ATP-binding protein [Limnobacter sp. CACIAM 66H1]|uniref:ABC transporter ATP-binding protein n=1 Tax=Limnobacter sp. CACIAM 66H1 TaxID=1813033 RepID=UPI0025C40D24|nr:ABC transporter ATP-binding protein [Limnobacter sp. CACIAM 66H1]
MKIYQDLKLLWPHVSPQRRKHLVGLLFLMLIGACAELISLGAIVPFIAVLSNPEKALEIEGIRLLLDLTNSGQAQLGIVVSIALAMIVGLATVVRLVLLWATNKVVFGIGYDIGVGVFSKTLHRPYSWHVSRNSSEVLGGLTKAQIVVQGYLLPLLNAIVAVVLATGMIAMLVYVDPFVAVTGAGAFGLLYFAMALSIRKKIAINGEKIAESNNKRIQEMQEGIGGIRDVILDSSQQIYINRFASVDETMRQAQASNTFLANSPRLAIEGLGLMIIAGFALIATKAGDLNELLPVLGALGLGAQKLMPLIQQVYMGWNSATVNRRSLFDVLDLLGQPDYSIEPSPVTFKQSLTLLNITYHYPTTPDRPALEQIDLNIKKGQVVGIVGKTGSGKSTLVDLLMGLIPASEGDFLVDENRLDSESKLRGWSSLVAHVPQSIFLADCSIAQNIALGVCESEIDESKLRKAAKAAEIDGYINSLSGGYKTEVGERGVRLSGGQRQRIGIARALYRHAEVLVLDEATSALDDATEKKVIDNIHSTYPHLTIVMVAHRLTTLRQCDFIVQMVDGAVSKLLSYNELTATN